MPYRWAMAMQQYSCMAPIPLCGQRAVQGRESLTMRLYQGSCCHCIMTVLWLATWGCIACCGH